MMTLTPLQRLESEIIRIMCLTQDGYFMMASDIDKTDELIERDAEAI